MFQKSKFIEGKPKTTMQSVAARLMRVKILFMKHDSLTPITITAETMTTMSMTS